MKGPGEPFCRSPGRRAGHGRRLTKRTGAALLLPFISLALAPSARAQGTPVAVPAVADPAAAGARDSVVWSRSYGGPGRDVGGSIADAPGGGWLVVGSTRSFGNGRDAIWLLRLNARGDTLWTRTIGAPPDTRTSTMSVAPADDGWVIGGVRWFGQERNYDIILIGIDTLGQERWTRTYGGPGYDHFEVIRRAADGGYIIGGGTTLPGAKHDSQWVLRTDAWGDTLWTRVFPGAGFGHADAIVETADGGFVFAGGVDERPGDHPPDLLVQKIDNTGKVVWSWRYGGPEIHAWAEWIELLPDGGFILVGPICEPCSPRQPRFETGFDALVVRLSEHGDTVWTRRLSGMGEGNDLAYFVTVTSRATYMVGGATTPAGGATDTPWLIELDSIGNVVWARVLESTFPRNGVAQIREVAPNEFLVTGPPWLYQREGDQDLWIVRLRREP
jgi:hypothetical protein